MTFGPPKFLDLVYEIIKPGKAFKIYFKDIFYVHTSILKQTCIYEVMFQHEIVDKNLHHINSAAFNSTTEITLL